MLDALASKVFVISSLLHGNQDLYGGGGIRFEMDARIWCNVVGAWS